MVEALPPHIDHWYQRWLDNRPAREARREWLAQMERAYPRVKTSENGYGWWFSIQEDYARLAREYLGFDGEWRRFYEEWSEREPGSPTGEPMREEFIRVCFSRGARQGGLDLFTLSYHCPDAYTEDTTE